jgi:hypothetical protein
LSVKEDIPQKVVVIDNVIQTRYAAGKRTVVVGRPVHVRPRGHRIRHSVHYLPGIRHYSRRNGPPLRPVVIRKKDLMPHRIQRLKSRADTRHRRVSDVLFAAVRVSSCIQRDTVPAKPPRFGGGNVDKGKT